MCAIYSKHITIYLYIPVRKKRNVWNRNKPYETVAKRKKLENRRKVLDFGLFSISIHTVFYDFIGFCTILYDFLHLLLPCGYIVTIFIGIYGIFQ